MNLVRIMRIMHKNASIEELLKLSAWCAQRAGVLHLRALDKAAEAAWNEISSLPVGSTVFSHLDATKAHTSWAVVLQSVGRPHVINLNLFGMPLKVYAVDKTRIWLSYSAQSAIAFTRDNILGYQIKTVPPVEAVTKAILANTQP